MQISPYLWRNEHRPPVPAHSSLFTEYWEFSGNFQNPLHSAAISKSICERFCRTGKHLTAAFPLSASTESKLLLNDFKLGLLLIKFSRVRRSQRVLLVCSRSTPRWSIVIYLRCDKSSARHRGSFVRFTSSSEWKLYFIHCRSSSAFRKCITFVSRLGSTQVRLFKLLCTIHCADFASDRHVQQCRRR